MSRTLRARLIDRLKVVLPEITFAPGDFVVHNPMHVFNGTTRWSAFGKHESGREVLVCSYDTMKALVKAPRILWHDVACGDIQVHAEHQ